MGAPRIDFIKSVAMLLTFLDDAGNPLSGETVMSKKEMAASLDWSVEKVKKVKRKAQSWGLLEAEGCWSPSGQQLENIYRITPEGRQFLQQFYAQMHNRQKIR